jgi:hypothetical protein
MLLAATVVGACSRFTVETKYDRTVNFTPLHTYAWRPGPPLSTGDPRVDDFVLDQRVRGAIERVLAKKGFRQAAEGAKPDFFVGYYVALRQNTRAQSSERLYGSSGWGWSHPDTYEYDEGTLQIDIVDSTNSKLLWRGAGVAVVDPSASPETRAKRINAAVAQILSKFPPKVGVSLS